MNKTNKNMGYVQIKKVGETVSFEVESFHFVSIIEHKINIKLKHKLKIIVEKF